MRILVTGSRTWEDHLAVHEALRDACYQRVPAVIVHGDCPSGADAMASWWVRQYAHIGVTEEAHPASWTMHDTDCPAWHRGMRKCRRAGHRRNAKMAALGADVCLAFVAPCDNPKCRKRKPHDSHGTAGMIELCEKAGISVLRCES